MLSLSICAARRARGAVLVACCFVFTPMLWAQESAPPAGKQKPEAAEPSPSDAQGNDQSGPARRRKKPAAELQQLPEYDFARLAHPSVADQLELTDEQRASVSQIINRRASQLAAAAPEERDAIIDQANRQLADLLNEQQLAELENLSGDQRLRFNFREQAWPDVLDWFARQAGLALVMDKSPPGAFTYTNNRAYSPTEAIDLLNSVLLTKGFTLLQRGRMLILVDLSDDLPTNLIPRVPAEEIGQHGDFEIISVLFPLDGRPADTVVKEIQPLIGTYGSCVGLPQTGQLLVTETAGKMRAISILIASIPKPKPPEKKPEPKEKPAPPPPVLAVYPVQVVKPEAAIEILSVLFPSSKFTIDDKADQILAYGRPKEQEAIKAAIEQMEANRPADKQPRLEVYQLDVPDGEQLVEQLQTALPAVQASFDESLGRLLVFAEPDDQETVKDVIQKLGAEVDLGTRQIVVYQPKHFDPSELTTLIEQLAPRAVVSTDAQLRRVVVSASEAEQKVIKSLVDQLDQESALEDKPLLQVYPLAEPVDATLVTILQNLLPNATVTLSPDSRRLTVVARVVDQAVVRKMVEQWSEVATAEQQDELKIIQLSKPLTAADLALIQKLVPGAQATLSTDSRSLTVIARPEDLTAIQALVDQLTEAVAAQPKPELKVYSLAEPFTADDVSSLTKLVPGAQITLSTDGRQLRVMALADEHEELGELIKQLETAAESENKPVLSVVPLSKPLNPTIMSTLTSLVPQAELTWDDDAKRLIVVATPEDQSAVRETIDQLLEDGGRLDDSILRLYSLSPAQQTRFEAIEDEVLQDLPGMRVIKDPQTGELAVWARQSEHEKLAGVLDQLKVPGDSTEKRLLIGYPIANGTPASVLEMLQQVFPSVKFSLDEKADRILAYASLKEQGRIKQTIAQLDQEGVAGSQEELRSYAIGSASATSIATMLQQLVPDMQLTPDQRADSIMAWGTVRDHEVLKKALEQIRNGDPEQKTIVRAYPMPGREIRSLIYMRGVLLELVPEAAITIDGRGGSIVVAATAKDHEKLKEAIDEIVKLDSQDQYELEIYTLDKLTATQVRQALDSVVPAAEITTGDDPRQIVVWATAEDQQRVAAALKKLEEAAGKNGDQILRLHRVRPAVAAQAGRFIARTLPNMQVLTGAGTDRILVWGTPADQERLATLLAQMETELGLDAERQMKTYELGDVSQDEARRVLDSAIGNLEYVEGEAPDQLVVWASAAAHEEVAKLIDELKSVVVAPEPKVVIYRLERADPTAAQLLLSSVLPDVPVTADPVNRTLAVTATEEDQQTVRETLDQLDDPGDGDLITETYVMKRGNPTAVMTAIKPIVPRATISSDVTNKMLIVTATAEEHKQIKAIVERADGEGEGAQVTKAYPLKYANAYTISTALAQVVPAATVSPDALNKMLIVTASEEDHKRIQEVLDQADKRGGGDLLTKAYVLQVANPSTISVALRAVVPNATVSPDTVNQMLVVTASQEDHDRIQAIVDEADRRSEGELTTTVYALKFANPIALSTSIKPIAPNATVSPDVYNKTLIVTATAKDHERIKAVIDQADKRGGGELLTKAYSVKWANAVTIATALSTVVPDAKISSDIYNKMLIVTANEEDHIKIQEVLDQADQRGGGTLTTRAYTLQTANPSTIMVALRPVVPDATISSDVTNKMLIVTASEKDHQEIQAIIDEADRRSEGELKTTVYALEFANPIALSTSIKPIAPNATVSPDVYNKTLIVTATGKDHERIKAIIDQADKRGGGDLVTKAYPVKWANPVAISTALATVVPDAKISSDVYNKMLIVTADEEDHTKIQNVLDQADKRGGGDLVTKAYSLKWANPVTINTALTAVVPDAKISSDTLNKMLIVTANTEDHAKIDEVLKQADQRGGGDLTTEAYSLRTANPTTIMVALRPVVPDATISADPTNRVLIVTASADDHARVKTIVDAADRRGEGELVTEAYSLKWANPRTLEAALAPVVPNATVTADVTNKTLVVTATESDQQLVQKVVDSADRRGEGEMTTEVYLLTRANPTYVQRALLPLAPDATFGADPVNKTLIVTAPEKDQEKIRKIIETADRRGAGDLVTKVYPLKLADARTAATALETLIPNAQMSADRTTNALIVTATDEEQQRIDPLIKEMDVAPPSTRVLKPYSIKNAEPQQVYESLSQLFRYNRDVSVGYQDETGMILVFAPAVDQEEVGRAIDEIEKATALRPKATLEVYPLEGLDGDAALDTLTSLLRDETPAIEVQLDDTNNQLLVIADPEQQDLVRKALSRLEPVERDVEVFRLERLDPYTAESAIDTLFADLPYAAMPSVEADPDNQQLIVQATKVQLERIGQLLEKMGEGNVQQQSRQSNSMLRVIMLSNDTDELLKEVEQLWPRIRQNPIQVVKPPQRKNPSFRPLEPADARPENDDTQNGGESNQNASGNSAAQEDSASQKGAASQEDTGSDDLEKAAMILRAPVMFTSAMVVEEPIAGPQTATDPPADGGAAAAATGNNRAEAPEEPLADEQLPPIVIIAGEGQLTVASRDIEALNQFEELLRTLQRGRRVSFSNGNFSMYLLQNADAEELAEVLNSLFRRDSRSSRSSFRAYSQRRSTSLMVVADKRMNAILVYGSASDRATVEEMLDVLDSPDIPESLTTERPKMIPVKNLPANTVLSVLESVYKTQLSTRRGLRPVTIPVGISREMTSMLELLNATANAPLLTLDVDETTNSIVMRGPRQLCEEIEGFIQELDEQAKDGGKRNISLVPLKGMNSDQIEDALQLLMRGGRYRRSSSYSSRR